MRIIRARYWEKSIKKAYFRVRKLTVRKYNKIIQIKDIEAKGK